VPYLLHIETSTKTCSIALSNGTQLVFLDEDSNGEHTAVINNLIRSVLSKSGLKPEQLDAITVNEGPGSYTALRIGVVTAKGLSYALDKPLILISGLQIIAYRSRELAPEHSFYISMIDARRDEVYLGVYNNQLDQCQPIRSVILNNQFPGTLNLPLDKAIMGGNGTNKCSQYIDHKAPQQINFEPSAIHMIPLAFEMYQAKKFTDCELAKPFYLKPPNITTPKKNLITP
jgi:tRNA threonylcarbamoyladenosine biosynthesis protein TsaB